MSKSILEKIYDKIDKLEKQKRDYLEVGKMQTVNRKDEEIEILNLALNGLSYRTLKKELDMYKKFIKNKGFQIEFENYQSKEVGF